MHACCALCGVPFVLQPSWTREGEDIVTLTPDLQDGPGNENIVHGLPCQDPEVIGRLAGEMCAVPVWRTSQVRPCGRGALGCVLPLVCALGWETRCQPASLQKPAGLPPALMASARASGTLWVPSWAALCMLCVLCAVREVRRCTMPYLAPSLPSLPSLPSQPRPAMRDGTWAQLCLACLACAGRREGGLEVCFHAPVGLGRC